MTTKQEEKTADPRRRVSGAQRWWWLSGWVLSGAATGALAGAGAAGKSLPATAALVAGWIVLAAAMAARPALAETRAGYAKARRYVTGLCSALLAVALASAPVSTTLAHLALSLGLGILVVVVIAWAGAWFEADDATS